MGQGAEATRRILNFLLISGYNLVTFYLADSAPENTDPSENAIRFKCHCEKSINNGSDHRIS